MKKMMILVKSVLFLLTCLISMALNAQTLDTVPSKDTITQQAAPAEQKPEKEKADGFNSKTRFGIRLGGIMSKTDFENSNDPTADPESKIGADLAILCAIPIGGGFFMLQPELHWLQKGYKIEDINTGDDVISTLNYIELPLLLRLNFGGSIKLFGFAGPSIGYLLDGELNTSSQSLDATEYLDQTEYNAHIGLGVGLGTFEIDVRYIAGLTDISDAENLEDVKNSSFGAGITLKF
jgi:hypothetical protein